MMDLLYDDDYILDAYARDIRREAEGQAEKRAAKETATRMLKAGESVKKISEYVPPVCGDNTLIKIGRKLCSSPPI